MASFPNRLPKPPPSLVRLTLLLLALLATVAVALAEPPKLFVAEVVVWRAGKAPVSQFLLLEWRNGCKLEVRPPEDSAALLVRVDASTPFKPSGLAIDGSEVVPRASEGVVLIEDFVWVNFTRLGFVPKVLALRFAEYPAKPPVYALSDREGERVWGYLVSALLRNASPLDSLARLKLTVLTEEALTVPLAAGGVTLWSLTLLTAEPPQLLLDRLRGVVVELKVVPLYYSELKKASSVVYVYANKPASCQVELDGYAKVEGVLGQAFPGNPALLRPLPNFRAAVRACGFEVENPGPYDYVVEGRRVAPGRSASLSTLYLSGAIAAAAYRKGVLVYNLSVYGYAPKVKLPAYSYNVRISVTDAGGEPVSRATALLVGAGGALRELTSVVDGLCAFENVPPGEYIVSIAAGGKEVGRTRVRVEQEDVHATLNTSLLDFEIAVVYPNGGRVTGYAITLEDGEARYVSCEAGGKAFFEDVPAGRYSYAVRKGNLTIAEGIINVEVGRKNYVIVLNLSRVFVKVVDVLGRPIPNTRVEVRGPVTAAVKTDSSGSAALDLKPGTYEVVAPELRLRTLIEVRSTGAQVTLVHVPRETCLVAAGALVTTALAAIALRKRGSAVEVLELEGEEG